MAPLPQRENSRTSQGRCRAVAGIGKDARAPELTDKAIQKLLRALLLSPNPRRDRAILQLFLHYGCSVRDVISLEEADVDLAAGRIRWRLRGQDLWSPLPPAVAQDIADYCRRERRARSPRLFTTRLGHPLSYAHVARIFRFLEREAGLPGINPLALREHHRNLLGRDNPAPLWIARKRPVPWPPCLPGTATAGSTTSGPER